MPENELLHLVVGKRGELLCDLLPLPPEYLPDKFDGAEIPAH